MSDFEDYMIENSSSEPTRKPTLRESEAAGYGSERRENLPIVSRLIAETEADERGRRVIFEALERGDISQDAVDMFDKFDVLENVDRYDVEGMLNYMEQTGINTEYGVNQYREERNQYYADMRNNDEEVFVNQGWGGSAMEMIGRGRAMLTDPLYLAMLPLSIGSSTTILSAGLRSMALEGVLAAGVEPFVWDFKKDIGSDYGWKDALLHIGGATVLGGVLGAGGKLISSKLFGKTAKELKAVMEDIEAVKAHAQKIQKDVKRRWDTPMDQYKSSQEAKMRRQFDAWEKKATPGGGTRRLSTKGRAAGIEAGVTRAVSEVVGAERLSPEQLLNDTLVQLNTRIEALQKTVLEAPERIAAKQELTDLRQHLNTLDKTTPEGAVDTQLVKDQIEVLNKAIDSEDVAKVKTEMAQLTESINVLSRKDNGSMPLTNKEQLRIEIEKVFRAAEKDQAIPVNSFEVLSQLKKNEESFYKVLDEGVC